MPKAKKPRNPIDAYKAIIDQLVNQTSSSIAQRLVKKEGIYSRSLDSKVYNDFVATLTKKQRLLLGEMLHQQRTEAIFDVLALLTWWLLCKDVGLTYNGQPMPFELSGMGMEGDYSGRLTGWKWPKGTTK